MKTNLCHSVSTSGLKCYVHLFPDASNMFQQSSWLGCGYHGSRKTAFWKIQHGDLRWGHRLSSAWYPGVTCRKLAGETPGTMAVSTNHTVGTFRTFKADSDIEDVRRTQQGHHHPSLHCFGYSGFVSEDLWFAKESTARFQCEIWMPNKLDDFSQFVLCLHLVHHRPIRPKPSSDGWRLIGISEHYERDMAISEMDFCFVPGMIVVIIQFVLSVLDVLFEINWPIYIYFMYFHDLLRVFEIGCNWHRIEQCNCI